MQAVITRRAFTALNEIPTAVYAASQNKAIKVGFKDFNGRNFGYAFRLESTAYRNTVEGAIECMKKDGTLVKMYEKWYGSQARPRLVDQHDLPGLRRAGLQGLRRHAARGCV